MSAPGAQVDVVLHERVALCGRLLDGIALSQERIDHVVDIPCRNSIDRLLPEMLDGDGQPPVQVDPTPDQSMVLARATKAASRGG
jgi:hypothetical protein